MDRNNNTGSNQDNKTSIKVANIVAIVLSVLLIPILTINCILIIQGMVKPNEVPSLGKMTPLIVLTESMDPKIKSGDLIITKKVNANEIKEGDVITFFDPEGNGSSVVTHRVIKLEFEGDKLTGFRTQGDNNEIEDRLSVPVENLVGRWTGTRIRFLGHVILFTQSTWGIIICIVLPVGAFVVYEVLRRRKQDKDKQSDIDTLKAELEALRANNAQAGAQTESTQNQGEQPQSSPTAQTESAQPAQTDRNPE